MDKKIFWFMLAVVVGIMLVGIIVGTLFPSSNLRLLSGIPTPTPLPTASMPPAEVFAHCQIPNSVFEKMLGNSIPKKDLVNLPELSYLTITYWGFDDKAHIGEMIVHKDLAQEVLDIFAEVYDQKYPIEKMRLIDEYQANDEMSMADNNSSAFCYRTVANTNKQSKHSLGRAIDINPLYNPYVVGDSIMPAGSEQYVNRKASQKGMIHKGDALYNAFLKRGWTWGGNWVTQKDYQHFEKK